MKRMVKFSIKGAGLWLKDRVDDGSLQMDINVNGQDYNGNGGAKRRKRQRQRQVKEPQKKRGSVGHDEI